MMASLAKTMIVFGIILIFLGILVWGLGKIPGVGKLPGDILIKKDNVTFYFPLATCLLLSVLASVFFCFWNQK